VTFAPQYTTGRLAGLASLGIELPAPVTQAITAFTAAQQVQVPALPQPDELARQAVRDLAAALAQAAAGSAEPSFDLADVSTITAARALDQALLDQHELATELRDAAARLMRETVTAHYAEVTAAIQGKHAATVAELVKRARRLPPGATDVTALETGGQHRADWIASRDLAAELDRLRAALRSVDDRPPPDLDDGIAFCTAYERSGKLATVWLAPSGVTTHGPLGSLEFWLDAAREAAYEWWLPLSAEQSARIDELRMQRQAERASELPPVSAPRLRRAPSVF
jgi:hypothetical protein